MQNQFYYTDVQYISKEKTQTVETSFNLNKVIMTVKEEDGTLAVILDDYHERIAEVPDYNAKGMKKGMKNKHYTHQTVIHLNKEDAERFVELTKARP